VTSIASIPETIPLQQIQIDDRLREDLGDIAALTESIARFGLIQPIVVDADNTLVAGFRRLSAVQQLGWTAIPVRRYGTLTAQERLDIELEENERRKELTVYERAKAVARLATRAREAAAELDGTDDGCADSAHPDGSEASPATPGQRKPGSLRDIQRRLGVSESTIRAAEKHVAVVTFYPELAPLPQYRVFDIADKLDQLPTDERPSFLTRIAAAPSATWAVETDLIRAVKAKRRPRPKKKPPQSSTAASPDPLTVATGPTAAATEHQLLTPEEEENLGRRQMRRAFAEARDRFWDIMAIQPRALRKALEPTDMLEVRDFITKLCAWGDAWDEVLR